MYCSDRLHFGGRLVEGALEQLVRWSTQKTTQLLHTHTHVCKGCFYHPSVKKLRNTRATSYFLGPEKCKRISQLFPNCLQESPLSSPIKKNQKHQIKPNKINKNIATNQTTKPLNLYCCVPKFQIHCTKNLGLKKINFRTFS